MKKENLEQAVRLKERLDKLNEMKTAIECHMTNGKVTFSNNSFSGEVKVTIQDDALTGILYKYCEETIALIEQTIEKL